MRFPKLIFMNIDQTVLVSVLRIEYMTNNLYNINNFLEEHSQL